MSFETLDRARLTDEQAKESRRLEGVLHRAGEQTATSRNRLRVRPIRVPESAPQMRRSSQPMLP